MTPDHNTLHAMMPRGATTVIQDGRHFKFFFPGLTGPIVGEAQEPVVPLRQFANEIAIARRRRNQVNVREVHGS